MKKILCVLLVLGCLCLFGCNYKDNYIYRQNISEYRQNLFLVEGKDFVVSFTSGKREQLYKYDGVKTSLVDFGVLSVRYISKLNTDNVPHYTLFIDTMQYEGVLEFNPIDSTYVADIAKTVSDDADLYVRIYGGGIDDQMKMPCVSQHWAVSYKQAFDMTTNTFAEKLSKVYETIYHSNHLGSLFGVL